MSSSRQPWSTIAAIVGQRPEVTRKVHQGLLREKHFNVVTYRMKCGHEIVRRLPRLKPALEPGNKLPCEHCKTEMSEVANG